MAEEKIEKQETAEQTGKQETKEQSPNGIKSASEKDDDSNAKEKKEITTLPVKDLIQEIGKREHEVFCLYGDLSYILGIIDPKTNPELFEKIDIRPGMFNYGKKWQIYNFLGGQKQLASCQIFFNGKLVYDVGKMGDEIKTYRPNEEWKNIIEELKIKATKLEGELEEMGGIENLEELIEHAQNLGIDVSGYGILNYLKKEDAEKGNSGQNKVLSDEIKGDYKS